ncbi:hypothetical protein RGQ15_08735 [Paracoccus sp. MBLB3053]|uniref:Component of SufBCD complex n=1 Tax=Paracoccus aurantius TaxID=3073814 RepID=A0ABU2HRK4_9RHOB|nr:hypothetical protein [Paracoccus sp. MBLB3053]MDS9467656.1 hypothetical protein [Paracoccus sp. MBLB3053]
MPLTQGILTILDSRSFGSIWFWLLLTLAWIMAGRRILGVPADILSQVPRKPGLDEDHPAALLLLDWLSLTLPRWRIASHEATILMGISAFIVTVLSLLGFAYGLEMAQALVLLTVPFFVLFILEARLARRVETILQAAERGEIGVNSAAYAAARLMRRQRGMITAVSILAVAVTAYRGAIWMMTHPFGF